MDFKYLDSETIYEGRVFKLERIHVLMPDRKEAYYDLVNHPGAVAIVPLDDDGNIWFVQQYRVGIQRELLELPAGTLEQGEDPEVCAAREIREEIGYAASELKYLGSVYTVPGYSSEKLYFYLATGLYSAPLEGDEDEFINTKPIALEEAYRMADTDQFQDSKTLAGLMLAKPYIQK